MELLPADAAQASVSDMQASSASYADCVLFTW